MSFQPVRDDKIMEWIEAVFSGVSFLPKTDKGERALKKLIEYTFELNVYVRQLQKPEAHDGRQGGHKSQKKPRLKRT